MNSFSRRTFSFLAGSASKNTPANDAAVFLGVVIFVSACSSGPAPLSIKMVNPETKQTLNCNAKDSTGRIDREVLASAVESCARQLEARGFVREK